MHCQVQGKWNKEPIDGGLHCTTICYNIYTNELKVNGINAKLMVALANIYTSKVCEIREVMYGGLIHVYIYM